MARFGNPAGSLKAEADILLNAGGLFARGTETPTQVLTETLDEGDGTFVGKDVAAAVVAGRTYALSIEADIGSTTASVGLLGAAIARFDNVALTTEDPSGEEEDRGSGDGGDDGSDGADGSSTATTLTADELRMIVRRGDAASASLSGRMVFVRLRVDPAGLSQALYAGCSTSGPGGPVSPAATARRCRARAAKGKIRVESIAAPTRPAAVELVM